VACSNQAYWDSLGTIHVCVTVLEAGGPKYAASVDLGVLGHEFQHAVTQYTLGLKPGNVGYLTPGAQDDHDGWGQSGSINESLSDIYDGIRLHELHGAAPWAPHARNGIDDAMVTLGRRRRRLGR
jgi:hypothetical protein